MRKNASVIQSDSCDKAAVQGREHKSYRMELDSIGERELPCDAYYGVQSLRASENFRISGHSVHPEMIRSLAFIKKAAAITNEETGLLDRRRADAIVQACDEILAGNLHGEFIVDPIQGGAGTSLNMNANEVIANRAIEILGGKNGDYDIVHPNDHVNMSQSTNDVIPTAGRMTVYTLLEELRTQLSRLAAELVRKSEEFDHILKVGRTQMQDAVPIRLGQEFEAYADAVIRSARRIDRSIDAIRQVNLGGTAIGTGVNARKDYVQRVVEVLNKITGRDFIQSAELIESTQSSDALVSVSGDLKACAVSLSKTASDLRLMSSGPRAGFAEISLPAKQNGSSIMPGKVNPVIPEVVNQVAFQVIGNDITISMAAEAGQLELNAFEPVIFYNLFESLEMLSAASETFTDNCVSGITANEERCRELLESSLCLVTALAPVTGYQKAADIAKRAYAEGLSVREVVLTEGLIGEAELDRLLDAAAMTRPVSAGRSEGNRERTDQTVRKERGPGK